MALLEVGSATTQWDEDVGSISVSRAVTAGSTGLTVTITYYNGSGTAAPSSEFWNTTEALTSVTSALNGEYRCYIYRIVNPTSGTHNITVSFSTNVFVRTAIREWTGIDTTTPTHGANSATSDSGTATVNVASVVSGEVTIDACASGQSLTVTGANHTTTYTGVHITASNTTGAHGTNPTSTGTVAPSYTVGGGGSAWAICACAIQAAAGGGASVVPVLMAQYRQRR